MYKVMRKVYFEIYLKNHNMTYEHLDLYFIQWSEDIFSYLILQYFFG